jgi:hypothetical protein
MTTQTETRQLDTNLILQTSSHSSLIIHTQSLTFTKQDDTLIESCLTFQVNPEHYQRIDTEALFNLKPELRGTLSNGEFLSEPNIEITASLKPDLLPHLTPHLEDVPTYLKSLSQEQPDHPLLSTESWLALQVKQPREPVETGYRTFWDYVSPSAMTTDSIDSEKINDAIINFFKDWAEANLSQMSTSAISQSLEEATKEFETWVDTSLSAIGEDAISQLLEEMVKASEKFANASQSEISQQAFSSRKIFEAIINFFTEDDWAYTKIQGEPTLRLAFQGQNGKWTCYAKAREQQQQFVFYSICPVNVPETKNLAIAEFIARANFGMIIGNFELDFTDGEIRYKTSIDVEGANLTFPQIKRLVYANVMMMDQYLPGIMSVIDSDVEPKDAIAQIEG